MRRAREARPLRCLPAATARCDGREAVRSVSVADRAGGAFPADVYAHTVAHRSWCLTPGRSDLPTKIRTPVTGAFRSSGADACMLPRIPLSEGPTGACQPTVSRAWTTLPQCPQTSGRGGSRAHSAQTTRRARTKLGTVRSDAMTDLAHARRHGHAPPYGAQCRRQGPVPAGMAAWYKFF